MTESLHYDLTIAAPRERVWHALSTPQGLESWWVKGDIAPVVGHEFTLDMGQWGDVPCRVTEAVAPESLSYTWDETGLGWTLIWRMADEAEGEGTRLHLEHAGFEMSHPQHQFAHEMMGKGWRDDVLPRLAAVLEA